MHKPEDFVEAPRPSADVEDFISALGAIPKPTKKERKKWKKDAAKRKAERSRIERRARAKDKGLKYEVRFTYVDTKGFYEDRAVLPAAAMWNMDEFLMAYIAAGLDKLLKGHTDWDYWDKSWGKNEHKGTRKKLKRARDLARAFVTAHVEMKETAETEAGAIECLRIIAEVGVSRLWD